MEDIANIIANLGFPIAISIITIAFVYKLITEEREENRIREERLMAMIRTSIENNTKAIQELKDYIKGGKPE